MPNKNVVTPEASRSAAATLSEVQEILLAEAETLDFLQGYNLETSINDRLNEIGEVNAAEELYSTKVGQARLQRASDGKPTEMARLIALREQGLAAIEALRRTRQYELGEISEDSSTVDAVQLTDKDMLRQR